MLHICLLSKQIIPNLIPIMMKWPRHVIVICTQKTHRTGLATRFADILTQLGITSTILSTAPDSGFPQMFIYAKKTHQRIQEEYPGTGIVLNISGGGKLMAITFLEAWRDKAHLIQYTNMSSNHLEYLPASTELIIKPVKLDPVMNISLFLAAQGVTYISAASDNTAWQEVCTQRHKLSQDLAIHAAEISGMLRVINALSCRARDDTNKTLKQAQQRFSMHPNAAIQTWLQRFEQQGLIIWDRQQTVEFTSYENAQYLGGFWLEEYIYTTIRALNPNDISCGVVINWQAAPSIHNELDILVAHNNRLLVIECKTLFLGTAKDNEIIYKLDSISDELNGLLGSTLLVSAQQPTSIIRQRASTQRIKVAGPEDLKYIDLLIAKWMENQSFTEPVIENPVTNMA